MRLQDIDFSSGASTFWAVFLGAFLATIGGLVAGQVEAWFRRRERERAAALLFGEVLSTLQVILRIAEDTRGYGDPYGPVTMRMLRAARREVDVYDRNRETLYELRDATLRVRIHTLIVRLTMPLDGLLDAGVEIAQTTAALRARGLDAEHRQELEADVAQLKERREQGFDFIMRTRLVIGELIAGLAEVARHDFNQFQGTTAAASGVPAEPNAT